MTRFDPSPPPEILGPLEHVIETAVKGGAPAPDWVAVEDPDGQWVRLLAAACPTERARLVVAVRSESGMVTAARLGVGGALRLPPSTPGAIAALRAAGAQTTPQLADGGLADLVGEADRPPFAVGWFNRPFWRCQLGERKMAEGLVALAAELDALPAVVPWPALVVDGRNRDEIRSAWLRVSDRGRVASEGLVITRCDPLEPHCGLATAAVRALTVGEMDGESALPIAVAPQPVYELPSGRRVGWWGPTHDAETPDGGWLAAPDGPIDAGYRWRLTSTETEPATVDDSLPPAKISGPALRIPGWISANLAPGRPEALILDRLATDAGKRGLPVWVPNLDEKALKLLLGKPGPFWVDGPASPRADVGGGFVR